VDPVKEELHTMMKQKLTVKFNKFDWDIHNANDAFDSSSDPIDQEYQSSNSVGF